MKTKLLILLLFTTLNAVSQLPVSLNSGTTHVPIQSRCPLHQPEFGYPGFFQTTNDFTFTNVPIDRSPQQTLIPPASHKAFVLCMGTSVLKVVDLETASVTNTISLNAFPKEMTMTSDGSRIIIITLSDEVPTTYPPDDCGSIGIPISSSPVIVVNTALESIDTVFFNISCMADIAFNDNETIMYLIGCQDYITAYDMNSYALLQVYNVTQMTGNTVQMHYATFAETANKLFVYGWASAGTGSEDQLLSLDLNTNQIHEIEFDTLGFLQPSFNPIILSPDKNDLYVESLSTQPPYSSAMLIFDTQSEMLKKIAYQVATTGNMIQVSDSTAIFDDSWLFGNKTLFDFKNYQTLQLFNTGGCSATISSDQQTLYLTQIGANHNSGVTYGSPQKYDITFLDLNSGSFTSVIVSDETFICSYERMIAMSDDGNYLITTNSAINSVTVLNFSPNGIEGAYENENITVYPNPFFESFHLRSQRKVSKEMILTISDLMGKIILLEKIPDIATLDTRSISLNLYPPGVYILKIIDGQMPIESFKLIKQSF